MNNISELLDALEHDMYAMIDSQYNVIYANPAWVRINSEESGKDTKIGCNLLKIYNDSKLQEQIKDLFEQVEKSKDGEYKTQTKFLNATYDVLYKKLKDGNIALVARDVTRYMLTIESQTIEKQAMEKFLSRTSHELRTPLNGILGFSQLVEMDSSLSMRTKSHNEMIQKSGKILLNIIEDILLLTQIKQRKVSVSVECTTIKYLIEESVKLLETEMNKMGITCDIQVEDTFLAKIDPLRFRQIMINLVSNSV